MPEKASFKTEEEDFVGLINEDNLELFGSLLLPDTALEIRNGEPVIALGWVDGDLAAGAIAGYIDEDSFMIESLYIAPGHRNRGGATKLLDELSYILYGDVSQIKAGFFVLMPEHEELEKFLRAKGFLEHVDERNSMFRTDVSELLQNDMLSKVDVSARVRNLADTKEFLLRLEQKRALAAHDPVPYGGFSSPSVRKDLSAVYIDDEEIKGYLIVEDSDNGTLSVSSALNRGGTKAFAMLLKKVLDNMKQNCGENAVLFIPVINGISAGIVKKLAPSAKQVYRLMAKDLI